MDCSGSVFRPYLVPVGNGRAKESPRPSACIQDEGHQDSQNCELSLDEPLLTNGRERLRKRFYILFVARGDDGQLRKIPIPIHYVYVLVAGAVIGFLSLTGIASSYTRMLLKVSQFNELRTEKEGLRASLLRREEDIARLQMDVAETKRAMEAQRGRWEIEAGLPTV